MAEFARKHHLQSAFYLGGFTLSGVKDDFLWVLERTRARRFRRKAIELGHVRDFNRIDIPGHAPDEVEKSFAELEGHAAEVLRGMSIQRVVPDGDDFGVLMLFVALLVARNAPIRDAIRESEVLVARKLMQIAVGPSRWPAIAASALERGVDLGGAEAYKRLRKLVSADKYRPEPAQNSLVRWMLEQMMAVFPYLANRTWSLIVADQSGSHFVCSDRPVVLEWTLESPPALPPGYGLRNTQVTVALSKDLALVGDYDAGPPTITADRRYVASFNSRTIRSSDRYVYSCHEDFVWLDSNHDVQTAGALVQLLKQQDVQAASS